MMPTLRAPLPLLQVCAEVLTLLAESAWCRRFVPDLPLAATEAAGRPYGTLILLARPPLQVRR